MALVQRIHEASGLGRPQPGDPIHSLDRDLLASTRLGRALGLDDGVLIRLSRVYGENLRRIALAARIAAHAGPGQVLVSDQVVAECGDGTVAFEPIGPVPLKGVPAPVPLHRATRQDNGG